MRFKSGLFTLTLFLCGTLLFCGCSQSSSDGANAPSGAHDSAAAQARVVVDAYGRSVKLPADVQSAVAVGSAARIVTYAGGQDKLIGVGELDKSAQTTMPYTIAEVATFKDLPVTNNGNHLFPLEVDVQSIRDLHPDVIISSGSAEECDTLQEETGIPVVGVFYQNQLFSEGIINSIDCVGEALGSESHAQSVIAKIQGWSDDLSE